jgi:hypothetical protein
MAKKKLPRAPVPLGVNKTRRRPPPNADPDRQPSPNWDDPQFEDFEEREDAAEIASEIAELVAARAKLDEDIKTKSALLNAFMSSYKDDKSWSMGAAEWVASYIKAKPRRTIVPELLVQQGVSMKKIQKATRSTPVAPYVQVRLRKQNGATDDSD